MVIDLESVVDRLSSQKDEFIAKCRQDTEVYMTNEGRSPLSIHEVGVRVHYTTPDS